MTNKVVLKSVDEFMADYVPTYAPIYPLFLGNSQSYAPEVGKINFKRLEAVGDLRAARYLPKDTEMEQIQVKEGEKIFKKYFFARQYTQSALQDQSRSEEVIKQVLDEHQKQADDLLLLGEGTSNSTMINNGIFWSNDENYVLNGAATVDGDGKDPLIDLHAKVIQDSHEAEKLAGDKVIVFYGSGILPYFDGVYAASSMPFKKVLQEVLGPQYTFVKMPADTTPSGASGWMIATPSQIMTHYTVLPQLYKQGINEEEMYSWHNFLIGSMMVDVKAKGGIIRTPASVNLGS